MSKAAPQEEPGVLFTLDVGLDSSQEPLNPKDPMTMSYQFAEEIDGFWIRRGDGPLKVDQGALIRFGVFDSSKTGISATLDRVELFFDDGANPFDLMPPIILTAFTEKSHEDSVALGIKNVPVSWISSPLAAINQGRFHFRIFAYVTLSGGDQKVFYVDPEMIVGGGADYPVEELHRGRQFSSKSK